MNYISLFQDNNINCQIIKIDNEYLFKLSDIGNYLGYKRVSTNIRTLPYNYKRLLKTDTNGGQQNVYFLNIDGIKMLICNARKRNNNMLKLARILNINILQIAKNNIESETINKIKKVFQNEEMIEQYKCDNYRIDLYFPKQKIAIECDELHHSKQENQMNDNKRQEYITNKLDCIFIRYNPYEKDFDIFNILGNIYSIISKKNT